MSNWDYTDSDGKFDHQTFEHFWNTSKQTFKASGIPKSFFQWSEKQDPYSFTNDEPEKPQKPQKFLEVECDASHMIALHKLRTKVFDLLSSANRDDLHLVALSNFRCGFRVYEKFVALDPDAKPPLRILTNDEVIVETPHPISS